MKQILRLSFCPLILLMMAIQANAQWRVLYSTFDEPDPNGTGNRTAGLGVIHENMFVALVTRFDGATCTSNYMIPYIDADSVLGRKYTYGYGAPVVGLFQIWSGFGGFDQVNVYSAHQVTATPDSFIYVANNDSLERNILVFKYFGDTIQVADVNGNSPRQITGLAPIWGIEVDHNGYVYVCVDTSVGYTNDIQIYAPIGQWTSSHNDAPVRTVDLPDGVYKGITVSPNGDEIFVSDYNNRKVLKYKGSIATGYTPDPGFTFVLGVNDTAAGLHVGPLGLGYLSPNNILAVTCAPVYGPTTDASYGYSRIYLLDHNTGALISPDSSVSVVDQAKWNLEQTGVYNTRGGGTASGYASVYAVEFDENGYLYCNSYYGWTIEKWVFNGTLPIFTGVERLEGEVPGSYRLEQNFPNPFNPATTIEFSIPTAGTVTLRVFNLLGQEVAVLLSEEKPAGSYRVTYDASGLPSGPYFCKLQAGTFSTTTKMLLVR